MRIFLFFFLLTVSIQGQSISGIVYDIETKQPIVGASVYLDGSSFGTITNEKGAFSLQTKLESTAALIITHIGLSSVKIDYFDLGENLKIEMREETFEIPEVIVTSDPFTRKQKLELFRKEFLGDSKESKRCFILNEDTLELYFNSEENTLSAYAREPLIVENQYLGYRIHFDLREFQVSFRSKSLVRLDNIIRTIYVGHTLFKDLTINDKKILVRRENVFEGSIQHLMRTIWNQDWAASNFNVRLKNKLMAPREVFNVSIGTALENKKVYVPEKRVVVIFRKIFNYRSTLTMLGEKHFFVDKYGNYFSNKQVLIGGHLSSLRVSEMLPFDYQNILSSD